VTHEEVDVAQVRDHAVYHASDVLLLRAAARSLDSAFVPWPDPADAEELRMWLAKVWEDPLLREAVSCASPSLALRADRIADGGRSGAAGSVGRSRPGALPVAGGGTSDSVRAVRRRGRG
jgi:hypothetical protein